MALMLGTNACKQQGEVAPQQTKQSAAEAMAGYGVRLDADRHTIARALAQSLQDPAMRGFVKSEALKKFDGDFDVLFQKVATVPVGRATFSERLASGLRASSPAGRISATEAINAVTEIASQNPLLNIAVPVGADEWDAATETPLVAVLPADYQEATTEIIDAYDSEGNLHQLDARVAPAQAVIVIGDNERVNQDGVLTYFESKVIEDERDLPTDDFYGGGPTVTCARNATADEYLTGLKSDNIGAIEGWPAGAPEFMLRILKGKDGVLVEGQKLEVILGGELGSRWEPKKRKQVNGRWWEFSDYLFRWTPGYGEAVWYDWYEHDPSVLEELPVTAKIGNITLTTTLKFPKMGERCGTPIVQRSVCWKDKVYGSNLLYFKLKSE